MALSIGLWCAASLLLLLAVPLHVQLAVERDQRLRSSVRCTWLFGLARFQLHPGDEPGRTEPTKARRKSRFGSLAKRSLVRPELRTRLFTFGADVLKAIHPREVSLRARIGLGDPADTGMLWGAMGPASALLFHRGIRLEPDFEKACLQFEGAATVRVIPIQLLCLCLALLLSPTVVRALAEG